MRLSSIIAASALAFALPAVASAGGQKGIHDGRSWQQRGCTVQQVHTPAGKPVQAEPIVRCPSKQTTAQADRPADLKPPVQIARE